MGKGLAILGLLLIIVGILPIILPMLGFAHYLYIAFFQLSTYIPGFGYSTDIAGYLFTDVMLILIGVGVLFLISGALR